jgi:lipocalin
MKLSISVSLASLIALAQAGIHFRDCQDPSVVQDFVLERYLGAWYEQQRDVQCFFEFGECVMAHYTPNDDGTVRVRNN